MIDPKINPLTLNGYMGWKKPQKSHIPSPKNPIKNPINGRAANGCDGTIFDPKFGLFDPKISTIDPKIPHFGPTNIYGVEKTPKIPHLTPKTP